MSTAGPWTEEDVALALLELGATVRAERPVELCLVADCPRGHRPHPAATADRPAITAHLRGAAR